MKKFKDTEVRWGIIGSGNVCEVKSAPAMQKIPSSELVAVMRRDSVKAADYAERHGVPKWYSDASDLINDPNINAIYIATPPESHLKYTKMAAAAGKPVYVEKPMARTHDECLRMIQACSDAGVPLFVAYYRRTLPHFLKVKSLIEKGAIGNVRSVHIQMCQSPETDIVVRPEDNWRVFPEISGGGYFYDLASHQLDLLDFLLGKIAGARGYSANQAGLYPAEDIVTGSFEFENGVLGTGNWCFTTAGSSQQDLTIIVGSKGQISYKTFGEGKILLETDEEGIEEFHFELPAHIQYYLIEKIVGELLGKDKSPSTGISAARTNRVMEQIVS
jgi:predicted dehydrogenase